MTCRATASYSDETHAWGFLVDVPFSRTFTEDLKRSIRQVRRRRWVPEKRAWWVDGCEMFRVRELVRLHFREELQVVTDAEQWERERARHAHRYGRQGRRERREEPKYRGDARRLDASATLFVRPDAPPEVVRAAHKALALLHHPDRGGSTERMARINAALDVLTRSA